MPKVWTSATVPRATPAAVVAAPIPAREDVRVRQPIPLEPTDATAFAHDHADLDRQIQGLMQQQNALRDAASVCEVQDLLFQRFKAKYIGDQLDPDYLDDVLTPDRIALLSAFRTGNVARVRSTISAGMSWDFVFPPATASAGGVRDMELEGFCRSPLALLVRPDEGNLLRFLPGVSKSERLALIEEALTGGCADPNYPRWYWSSPGAHACFEGDVEALELLHRFGCNLEQKLEWLLQPQPSFTFVHAAAFNGNRNVLEYLKPRVRPAAFLAVDGDGSNALHTLMESSRELRTAELLLELGLDGYCKNGRGRSALSMAIEALPELAARLLAAKARFEYRWWGNDLYWYSFDGIVLPTTSDGGAFTVLDLAGKPTTVEQLIVRHDRRELLNAPVMRAIIDWKWTVFASAIYQRRVAQYLAMVGGLLGAVVADVDSPTSCVSVAVCGGCWVGFVLQAAREVSSVGLARYLRSSRVVAEWRVRNLLNGLDAVHLSLVPLVPLVKLAVAAGHLDASAQSAVAPIASLLQITLSLRALQYVALYRSLGPLLVTIVEMFSDIFSFVGFYVFILLGFANGFLVLFSTAGAAAAAAAPVAAAASSFASVAASVSGGGASAPVSYGAIVEEELLWLLGDIDFAFFDPLSTSPALHTTAIAFFWAYTSLSVFIMLNLLIAIFNSTYERVEVESEAEWLWLRLEAMLDFEASAGAPGIEMYYSELRERNQRRAIRDTMVE